ncbi:putative manganese-dependent inorganic diphosphatase [Anoxynatronum sibiricum]|uniref:inorganic diphosphatase n=1 Tax=Anoxynatronum sibiricum TaxID=210623 RepID=A0ABU9VVB0_9CLOT
MAVLIFGHKNPDTDSVCSAIAYAALKSRLGVDAVPAAAGKINRETAFVLNRFEVAPPLIIQDVKTQVKDLKLENIPGLPPTTSILEAYHLMEEKHLPTLPVLNDAGELQGIVSMKDIAMGLIRGDFHRLCTSVSNLIDGLNGTLLSGTAGEIEGRISVIAFYVETIKGTFNDESIIIVGDRYDIIEHAIESRVQLIIITGGKPIPDKYIQLAQSAGVCMLSVPSDTYYTSKMIHQCGYLASIMRIGDVIRFYPNDYLEDVRDEMSRSHFRSYPVVDEGNRLAGFINRKHVLSPSRKRVVLVDHNEYAQSVDGLEEAEIMEIIDHHKLGDISTNLPISFRNVPVGSTCTIIYQMYLEHGLEPNRRIAGLLLSGILSDTLYFKSPTTTLADRKAAEELNRSVKSDLEAYAMEMFQAGTSLKGQSMMEIFNKDYKTFQVGHFEAGISQVFTLDVDEVFLRRNEVLETLHTLHENRNLELTMLLVTDILKEGSYLFYQCKNRQLIPLAFQTSADQGVFVTGLVSRKKQVVPRILEAIQQLDASR